METKLACIYDNVHFGSLPRIIIEKDFTEITVKGLTFKQFQRLLKLIDSQLICTLEGEMLKTQILQTQVVVDTILSLKLSRDRIIIRDKTLFTL